MSNGSFKDPRDGKTYRTVKIGKQVWMAENCQKYGKLYTWSAAMDSAALFSSNGQGCGTGKTCTSAKVVQGICPEGWVLPSIKDWDELFRTAGRQALAGAKLKSTLGWEKSKKKYR